MQIPTLKLSEVKSFSGTPILGVQNGREKSRFTLVHDARATVKPEFLYTVGH